MKKKLLITGTILSSLFVGTNALAASPQYEVKKGDSLYSISKKYDTSVQEIKSINKLKSNLIFPGQIIKIEIDNVKEETKTYKIKAGDSLSEIAASHNTTVAKLVKLNPEISNPNLIVVGKSIQLSGTSSNKTTTTSSSKSSTSDTYKVKSGDSLSKIARAQDTTVDVLLALNPDIKDEDKIRVGQVLKVSGVIASVPNTNNSSKTQQKTSTTNKTPSSSSSNTKQNQSNLADKVIAAGAKYLGAPYAYGASTNTTSEFDCSSFTLRAFKEGAGISLPRTSTAQSTVGTQVSMNSLQKGDLLFFDTDYDGVINHVGIYSGNGQMINAATSKGVSYASVNSSYWEPRMVKAVRVL